MDNDEDETEADWERGEKDNDYEDYSGGEQGSDTEEDDPEDGCTFTRDNPHVTDDEDFASQARERAYIVIPSSSWYVGWSPIPTIYKVGFWVVVAVFALFGIVLVSIALGSIISWFSG